MRYEKIASFKPPRRLHIFMRRTTISHFYFLIANPRRCPPCLGKSAFHLRRRVPDEAIPPSPPRMRSREQTGWGFAGTRLKKSPQERGRKLGVFVRLVDRHMTQIEKKSPRKGTKTTIRRLSFLTSSTLIEKKSPRKGTKTHRNRQRYDLCHHELKKSPQERGRKLSSRKVGNLIPFGKH